MRKLVIGVISVLVLSFSAQTDKFKDFHATKPVKDGYVVTVQE